MPSAVTVGSLVINMSADVAMLKTSLAEANRAAATSAEKMASGFDVIKTSMESAVSPLKTLTVNVGSLESNMAKAQASAMSLGKGLIIGAAAGMSIDAIKNKILGVIDTMAHLKEVSEKTGSSVENLSKVGFIAKQSGSDIDSVANALGKMSKGMAGADNDTKGAGLALKFLGISAKDAAGNLKDPAAMFTDVAKKLDGYRDGAGKAAVAQALFGKAGAEMLPTLKLLAEQGDVAAKVTDAQATAAQKYTRDLIKLEAQKGLLFKTIAISLLPTMSDFANAMLDATKNTNAANKAVKGLAEDNSIGSWADSAAMGMARLIDVIVMIPKTLSAVSGSFKVAGADVEYLYKVATTANPVHAAYSLATGGSPNEDLKKAAAERNQVLIDANAKYQDLWNYKGNAMEDAMSKRIAARKAIAAEPEGAKPALNYDSSGEDGSKAEKIDKEAVAYATLISAIRTKTAANQLELATADAGTASQIERIKLDQELASGKIKLTDEHKRAAYAAIDEQAATEALMRAQAGQREVTKYIAESTVAREQASAALNIEYAMYGKSTDARAIAMVAIESETWKEKELAKLREAKTPITDQIIAQLVAERDARTLVMQATLAQGKALGYASQLHDENKRFAAESIFDERARAAAILQIDANMWQQRIQAAGDGTEAQRKLQDEYTTWYQNQLAKPSLDELKKSVDQYSEIFRTGFADMLNKGKDGWKSFTKSLTTTFKTSVADQIYKMFAQPFVVRMVASLLGLSGAAGAASAASMAQGTIGSGSAINSIIGGLGSVGTAITGVGSMLGSSTIGAFGSGLSAGLAGTGVADAAAAYGAAGMGGVASGLSAGASVGSAASSGVAMIAAIPGWGWAALGAAAIGAYLMNDGPEKNTRLGFTSNNTAGNISINERGNEGKSNAYIDPGVSSAFGTFGVNSSFWMSSSSPTVTSFLATVAKTDDALATFLTATEKASVSTYLTGKQSTAHMGAEGTDPNANGALDGVFAQRINNILTGVEPGLASLISGFKGTSQELATEASALLQYRSALKGAGEAVFGVKVTLQDVAALKLPTENTSAALTRVTGEFNATNAVAAALGKTSQQAFGAVGLASEGARAQLILAAGGISALTQNTASFAQNFLSDAERLAPAAKAMTNTFASMGIALPDTRDQFKALVMGLDLTTQNGATTYASLMSVQDAFAQLHPLADSAANAVTERKNMQDQLDQLTMSSTQLLTKQRNALDASNRGIFDQIQAAQKLKDAQDAAKTSLGDTITKMKSFADATKAYGSGLVTGSLSTLTPAQQYAETKRQFDKNVAAAKGGDATAQGNYQSLATAFLTASQKINSSDSQYAADFAGVLQTTDEMSKWAAGQVDVAQASLDALNAQVAGIGDLNTAMLSVAQGIANLPSALSATPINPANYGGSDSMGLLVTEIKSLNAKIDKQNTIIEGLRTDANKNAGNGIVGNDQSLQATAETIVSGVGGLVGRVISTSRKAMLE